jgi:hypothetical protein
VPVGVAHMHAHVRSHAADRPEGTRAPSSSSERARAGVLFFGRVTCADAGRAACARLLRSPAAARGRWRLAMARAIDRAVRVTSPGTCGHVRGREHPRGGRLFFSFRGGVGPRGGGGQAGREGEGACRRRCPGRPDPDVPRHGRRGEPHELCGAGRHRMHLPRCCLILDLSDWYVMR